MGRFSQEFKDYEQYDDKDCYRKTVPSGMSDALADLFVAFCGPEGEPVTTAAMKEIADDLLTMAGKKETTNWEQGALYMEIKSAYHILREQTFDRYMDATLNAVQRLWRAHPGTRTELIQKVNDVLLGANFGYTIRGVEATARLFWEGRTAASAGAEALDSAAQALKGISTEALEHLEQARSHLLTPTKPRSRKDAVRDAMSAMEAMLKKLAGKTDFDQATKHLREEKIWGLDQIVTDGPKTWSFLHKHHPDVRHGSQSSTDLDLEEALYWIDRITTYVKYMANRKRALGKPETS